MSYYTYILKCSDGTFYVGITRDIEKRVYEHNLGFDSDSYTYRRRPVKLVFVCDFETPIEAIEHEKKIKKWSHQKKNALINGKWESLKELSKKKFIK